LIYNGQEVESPQQLGLFEAQPVAWNQRDGAAATAFYRRVLDLASTDAAFVSGDFGEVKTSAPRDVIAYRRGNSVVLVNTRPKAVRVTVKDVAVAGARDLLSDRTQRGGAVSLSGYGAMVLRTTAAR
jgi:hypothetical protein